MKKNIIVLILCIVIFAFCLMAVGAEGETAVYTAPVDIVFAETESSIKASWSASDRASEYFIAVSSSEDGFERDDYVLYPVNAAENSIIISELSEGTAYYIKIRTGYGENVSEWTEVFKVTTKLEIPLIRFFSESIVALEYNDGFEYSKDAETWQKCNVFTGLSEYTEYSFYRRRAGTDEASEPVKIFTLCSHSSVHNEHIEPTCASEGSDKTICDICGETVSSKILKILPHTFGEEPVSQTDATELASGSKTYVCSVCGEEKTEVTARIGCLHEHFQKKDIEASSCTENGFYAYVCDDCGAVIDIIEKSAMGHTPSEPTVIKEPTCITEGILRTFCIVCGETLSEEKIEMTPHTFSEWYKDDAGKEIRHCLDCGHIDFKEVIVPKNTSESAGITAVLGGGEYFSETVTFSASDITAQYRNIYPNASSEINKLCKNNGIATVYTIMMYSNGSEYVSAPVSVKIPTARFSGSEFSVFEILPDGTVNDCGAAVSGGYIVFIKKSNAAYAVVDTTGLSDAKPSKISPKVLIISGIIAVIIFLGGAGFAGYYMYSKFRNKKSREWLDDNPDMNTKQ